MGTRKTSRTTRRHRAVSPAIATVILVAIAITVAVAIAYWMGGITGTYTHVTQIEIPSALVSAHGSPSDWNVTLTLKNTGTEDVTLLCLFLNEEEVDTYGVSEPYSFSDEWATTMTTTQVIHSGETQVFQVFLDHDRSTLSSGTWVNLRLHSADGMDFLKVVELT
jgi:flagellin-like protein